MLRSIELSEEQERALQEAAAQQGLSVPELVDKLLEFNSVINANETLRGFMKAAVKRKTALYTRGWILSPSLSCKAPLSYHLTDIISDWAIGARPIKAVVEQVDFNVPATRFATMAGNPFLPAAPASTPSPSKKDTLSALAEEMKVFADRMAEAMQSMQAMQSRLQTLQAMQTTIDEGLGLDAKASEVNQQANQQAADEIRAYHKSDKFTQDLTDAFALASRQAAEQARAVQARQGTKTADLEANIETDVESVIP